MEAPIRGFKKKIYFLALERALNRIFLLNKYLEKKKNGQQKNRKVCYPDIISQNDNYFHYDTV